MLSSVLRSKRAILVNVQIMRAFIQLRRMYATHEDLKRKIAAMERKYDEQFQIVFEAIKQLIDEDEKPKRKIGYVKVRVCLCGSACPVKFFEENERSEFNRGLPR